MKISESVATSSSRAFGSQQLGLPAGGPREPELGGRDLPRPAADPHRPGGGGARAGGVRQGARGMMKLALRCGDQQVFFARLAMLGVLGSNATRRRLGAPADLQAT